MKKSVIPVRYGVLIAIGLIVYFLILSLVGVQTNPVFSVGNGVIVAFGLYKAMRDYKHEKGKHFEFQKGFMAGLFTGFNATIIFVIFFAIYVTNINTNFLPEMLMNWSSHYHVGVGIVVFVAAIMGFATTFVLTLSFMQLFKESWNTKKIYKSGAIEV
ncbi:DUF4199 domain-containing protein [Aquimarina muelleri]|uniref:DUF4199 domain-containing protein n=1 Tax=Aquimarina muelleri TaxID=279356 RepID=A0A918N2W2_9FLAO|nr:DUF4199 domain-containing protein [Aquimarina muelleri]MCX2761546.1 DUF4199 domain-containing protein [Aquimarina muelleri]GGX07926.1 hypothetical protein GCM10007384_07170 [Aquimarina muelleri]